MPPGGRTTKPLMKRRDLLRYLGASAALGALPGCGRTGSGSRGSASKPNIVFILADDLGYGELGCYGNTFNETPHMDRLAAQGMRFTDGYAAAPVCSPTRASIMTGLYPVRTGITDYLPPSKISNKHLEPEKYFTVNEALASAGYHTGMIGKWHLDTDFANNPGSPLRHGWHEVIGTETEYIAMGDYFYPYRKINTFTTGADNEYLTDRLFTEACGFVERNSHQPFCLYLSHYAVHDKLDAPAHLVEKYLEKYDVIHGEGAARMTFDPKDWQHKGCPDNPWMAAMVEAMDNGVGKLLDLLDRLGLAENTYVILFSDNGGAASLANNGPLRGFKGSLYEGGIREPLIIRRPGTIQPGGLCHTPVSSIDFFPTFCHWAGARLPGGLALDGRDISPLLAGGSLPGRNLFWHSASLQGVGRSSALRKENLKYIEFQDGRRELYDLASDLGETKDLSHDYSAQAETFREALSAWRSSLNATLALTPDSSGPADSPAVP